MNVLKVTNQDLVLQTWKQPARCVHYSVKEWQLLVRQARASLMLARLGAKLKPFAEKGLIEARVWHHFQNDLLMAERHQQATLYELAHVNEALAQINEQAVILKGAAYVVAELDASVGRHFNDIDLLVAREKIDKVEKHLWIAGYLSAPDDDYNKEYYRRWMHEIPALKHFQRQSVLDVHHHILPLTGKTKINLSALLKEKHTVSQFPQLSTLSLPALVLHSATHLFHEGEFDKGLRDLIDLELLLTQLAKQRDGYQRLLELARETGLTRVLFLALRYCGSVLAMEFPDNVINSLPKESEKTLHLGLLDLAFTKVFSANHSSIESAAKRSAQFMLYLRGHLLRMPLYLLLPHLLKKSFMQLKDWVKRSCQSEVNNFANDK